MPERDDQVSESSEQKQKDESTEKGALCAPSEVSEDIAGQGIAAGEVRVVEAPSDRGSSYYTLLALVLLVVLLGGGYYLVNGGGSGSPQLTVESKRSEPKRYPIDKRVEVEVVAQEQVAVAGAVNKPQSQNAVVSGKPKAVVTNQAEQPKAIKVVVAKKAPTVVASKPQYQVLVGPFLNSGTLDKARGQLQSLGFEAKVTKGRGKVKMTRLLEGVYPRAEARERLQVVKKRVGDAFMLQTGEMWAIYAGSFSDPERAAKYADQLVVKGVNLTPIVSEVTMNGKMLVAVEGSQQKAKKAAAKVGAAGLMVQVKKP